MFTVIRIQLSLLRCANNIKETQQGNKAQRLTIVNSGNPSKVLPAFATYAWSDKYNKVLTGTTQHNEQELKGYIRDQLSAYLSNKGYTYREKATQAEVIIGFLFASEDDIASKRIEQHFGLLPDVIRKNENDLRYKKGILLLPVLDNQETKIYWRSAVEGFVSLEKDKIENSSNELHNILAMMLGDFPKAGK